MASSFALMSAVVNSDKQNQLYVAVHFVTLGSTRVAYTDIHLRLLPRRAHFC